MNILEESLESESLLCDGVTPSSISKSQAGFTSWLLRGGVIHKVK
jgi:hypothetical protein